MRAAFEKRSSSGSVVAGRGGCRKIVAASQRCQLHFGNNGFMLRAAFRHRKKTNVPTVDVWRRRQQRHISVVRESLQKVKRTGLRFGTFLDDCELDPSRLSAYAKAGYFSFE